MKKERKIGKNLIDILMFSMYPDAKIIYREYIQNAYDAIIEAEKRSLLPNISYGNVSVNISSSLRRVSIKDNGTGISKESAATRLLDIADSYKDGVRTAGLYGIGRLVGLRFCEKLIFKTTYQGEDVCTIVKFDSDEARKILDDVNDHRDAVEVIDAISSVEYQAEILEDHYFEVILENVKTEYFSLLDEDVIEDYLSEVAPIDYGLVFKNLLLNPALKQQEFKILYDDLNFIQISINDKTDIRKRYEDIIDGTGDKIHSLEFFKLEDHYCPLKMDG